MEGLKESSRELVKAVDLADERQIVEELEGRVLDRYFYSFQIGGREVIGLSYAGTKAAAREMARKKEPITIAELRVEDEGDRWAVTAKSVNMATNEERYGFAEQSKTMVKKDGTVLEDEFARTKGISKAQRNALRAFIPEVVIQEMYRIWKEKREEGERFLGG